MSRYESSTRAMVTVALILILLALSVSGVKLEIGGLLLVVVFDAGRDGNHSPRVVAICAPRKDIARPVITLLIGLTGRDARPASTATAPWPPTKPEPRT
jgi:hypothetical protein